MDLKWITYNDMVSFWLLNLNKQFGSDWNIYTFNQHCDIFAPVIHKIITLHTQLSLHCTLEKSHCKAFVEKT